MSPSFNLALFFAVYVARCFLFSDASRQDCTDALGMESNKIQDSQLSSNTFSSGWLPEYGRLNSNGAWCSKNNDETSEYFQIDLLRVRHVSAIATQGVYWNYLSYYVKTYTIKHSYDGMDWLTYKDSDGDSDRLFTGNSDANSVKLNNFRDTFVTRYLRIYPKDHRYDMCLRVEVYGCSDVADNCSSFSTIPSGIIASPGYPVGYPSNKDCVWIISAPRRKNLVLMFTHFDIRRSSSPPFCKEDFVKVQDGLTDLSPHTGGKYCNGNTSMLITASASTVRVNFHSGNTTATQKGFQINYLAITPGSDNIHAEKACDGDFLALNCSGYKYTINILHATYGSFPYTCGQQVSSPSCPPVDVKSKVVSMCQDFKECHIPVKGALFDYNCSKGSETRQLQIFFQCTSRNIRTPGPSTIPTKPMQMSSTALSTKPTQMSSSAASTPQPTKIPYFSTLITEPTSKEDPEVSVKQAQTAKGLPVEAMVGIVAIVIVFGAVLITLFVFWRKRVQKDRGSPLPTMTLSSLEGEYATPANGTKKRSTHDSKAKEYETENMLYQSADSPETYIAAKNEVAPYDSCPVLIITENPLPMGFSSPTKKIADQGYELIKPPNGVAQSHYSLPDKKPPKARSIENPNYEKTLPITNYEYAKPEIKTEANC